MLANLANAYEFQSDAAAAAFWKSRRSASSPRSPAPRRRRPRGARGERRAARAAARRPGPDRQPAERRAARRGGAREAARLVGGGRGERSGPPALGSVVRGARACGADRADRGRRGDGVRDERPARGRGRARALRRADRPLPGWGEPLNKLATLEYLLGDYAGAARLCHDTLAIKPHHFGALSKLVQCELARGDLEAAQNAAMRLHNLQPSFAADLAEDIRAETRPPARPGRLVLLLCIGAAAHGSWPGRRAAAGSKKHAGVQKGTCSAPRLRLRGERGRRARSRCHGGGGREVALSGASAALPRRRDDLGEEEAELELAVAVVGDDQLALANSSTASMTPAAPCCSPGGGGRWRRSSSSLAGATAGVAVLGRGGRAEREPTRDDAEREHDDEAEQALLGRDAAAPRAQHARRLERVRRDGGSCRRARRGRGSPRSTTKKSAGVRSSPAIVAVARIGRSALFARAPRRCTASPRSESTLRSTDESALERRDAPELGAVDRRTDEEQALAEREAEEEAGQRERLSSTPFSRIGR